MPRRGQMAERKPSDGADPEPTTDHGSRLRRVLDQRADVLTHLGDDPSTKPALVEALGVSRSTVDRTLKTLTAHGLVRRDDGRVVATGAGRLAADSVRRYHGATADVSRTADVLRVLPADAEVAHEFLAGATVYRASEAAGRQALRAAMSVVEGAESVAALSRTVTDTSAPTAAYRLVVETAATLEVVYAPNVAAFIREEHDEDRREMAGTGRYRAFEASSVPFGLFIANANGETSVALAVYDAEETLVGVLTNDSDDAVEWAEAVYRRYRAAATEFTDEFEAT